MKIAIIGGGIAGLSAAYELEKAAAAGDVEYDLFESSGRLGGVIYSLPAEGCVVEIGPDSFVTEKTATSELCKELGIADQIVGSDDANRRTCILVNNKLVPLPDGLMFLVPTKLMPSITTPLFPLTTKFRMAMEFLFPPRPHVGDESVASLIERHYGKGMVDRLADPLLSGIYGGASNLLSAQSVLPGMVTMEQKYGSLGRGMLAMRSQANKAKKAAAKNPDKPAAPRPAPKPMFSTLRNGMQTLVDAIIQRIDNRRIHLHAKVETMQKSADGWQLTLLENGKQKTTTYDAIILAVPAHAAAAMLEDTDQTLAHELNEIPYSSSATVSMIYSEDEVGKLPEGFGFLVPASEKCSIMACTFVQRKFPARVEKGTAVLRSFIGEARNPDLFNSPDEVIIERVAEDMRNILGITAKPKQWFVHRWYGGMAQYAVGHKQRIEKIKQLVETLPGLFLAGNAYDGIGVSDCVRLGQQMARTALKCSVATPVSVVSA